ncbi:transcriptional regulator, LysR family [Limimonas halophila]|uniref:Transcriptional regulator, LysR family n=1 Tax=Limimonas halophila TaxID=1082479 RepID=A0A1G7TVZ0_9PROT|nr:LysR substrate-binding domain-containing protein [Limimonas halophila]SDG39194.1 transcriptional regulator, LysR family [Limimonas halophila]
MARRIPPATWLRAFDAAARHMSFTEAARELGVTQSAVSRLVRHLEQHVGQDLFVRYPRSIALTEVGRAYAQTVHEAFDRLAGGTEEVFGVARDEPLTVRATPGFAVFWLAPRLADFRARWPEVAIRLASGVWASDFTGDGADLEIRYGDGDWDEVEAVRLTRETIFPVCAPSVAAGLHRPADLAEATLIHAVGFEAGWPSWLDEAGADAVMASARAISSDTIAATVALARAGSGVALLRSSFADAALADGGLVAPFTQATPLSEAFYVTWPSLRPLRPEAAAFRDWLVGRADVEPDRPMS